MKCQSVQIWLMQVETLHVKDWPRKMNRHLKKCPACARTARTLYQIQEGWRNQPMPAECDKAKAAFLTKLLTLNQPHIVKSEKTSRRRKRAKPAKIPTRQTNHYRWLAVAAVLFTGVFLAALLLPTKTQASSADLVERLIDWNSEIASAQGEDRKRLLDDNQDNFKNDLKNANLSADDRELAEDLLKSGEELANADDEIDEAEIVQRIADKLFARAEAQEKAGNEKEFERSGLRFMRFKEHGYNSVKVRMAQYKFPEPKKGFEKGGPHKGGKGSYEHMMKQKKQVDKFLDRPPGFTRPDLNKKFEGLSKKGGATSSNKSGKR